MFDYRYHALSLAAVLLALADRRAHRRRDRRLQPRVLGQERHRPQPRLGSRPAHDARPANCRHELTNEEAFANGLYPLAVHELLAGRSIGLVFLGGSSDQVDGLVRTAVTQAGGERDERRGGAASRSTSLGIAHEASGTRYASARDFAEAHRNVSATSSAASSSAAARPSGASSSVACGAACSAPSTGSSRARRAGRDAR